MPIQIDPEFDLLSQFLAPTEQVGGQPIDYMAGLQIPTVAPQQPYLPITDQPIVAGQGAISPEVAGEPDELGFFEGLGILAGQFPTMVTDIIPETMQRTWRAFTQDMTLEDRTRLDELIRQNEQERERARTLTPEEREKTWFKVPFTDVEIKGGDLENAVDSIGYSIANLGAMLAGRAVAAGVGAAVAGPPGALVGGVVGGFGTGTAVTGGAMYDEFLSQMRDKFIETYTEDGQITPELESKWAELREELAGDARWYGFWEAAPETVGNMLMVRIGAAGKVMQKPLTNLLTKKVSSSLAKKIGTQVAKKVGVPATQLAAMLTEEALTEMVTQKKQADIEYRNGLRDEPIDYGQALKEVLPMVLISTPLLGGAVTVPQTVAQKVRQGQKPSPTEQTAMDLIDQYRQQYGLGPLLKQAELAVPTVPVIQEEIQWQKAAGGLTTKQEEDAAFERWQRQLALEHQDVLAAMSEREKQQAFQNDRQFQIEKMRRAATARGPQDPALREIARQRDIPLYKRNEQQRIEIRKRRDEMAEKGEISRVLLEQLKRQELIDLFDPETGTYRPAPVERDIKAAEQTAENLANAFDDSRNQIPPRLRSAFEIMRRNVAEGEAKNYRLVVDSHTGARELIPTGSSYEAWFRKRHLNPPFKVSRKDARGNPYYVLSEKDFTAIADNLEEGKTLTDRQQWIYDTALEPAAEMIATSDPELVAGNDVAQLESEGYDIVGQRMSPAEFPLGYDMVLARPAGLQEWTVINEDDGNGGTVLARNGERLTLDPFDVADVMAMRENPLMAAIRETPEGVGVAGRAPGVERREQPVREGGLWSPEFREAVRRAKNQPVEAFVDWGRQSVERGNPTVYELAERFGRRIEPKADLDEVFRVVHARIGRDVTPLKRYAEMTEEEKEAAVNGDFLTGLRGPRAWNIEDRRLDNVIAFDLDALKWINDNLGHDAGDMILLEFGDAMRASGLPDENLYRTGGDEFYIQHNENAKIEEAIENIQNFLDNNPVTLYIEGRPIDYRLEFSYGKAQNITEAEDALKLHKATREIEGTRPARGEIPPQIVRQLAERYGIRYPGSQVSQAEIAKARNKYAGETIEAAAIRLPDGRIETGRSHLEAFEKLSDQEQSYSPLVDGFVTAKGNFLVRELAAMAVNNPTMDAVGTVGHTITETDRMRLGDEIINSLPRFVTVKRPAVHETTGERIEVEDNARETLRDYDNEIEAYYELLGCVA